MFPKRGDYSWESVKDLSRKFAAINLEDKDVFEKVAIDTGHKTRAEELVGKPNLRNVSGPQKEINKKE